MPRRFWTEADWKLLAEIYPSRPNPEVAARLGRTVAAIYNAAQKSGLEKDRGAYCWLRKGQHPAPGTEVGRFPKGHVPANKGLRRPGWHAGRMKETQFKPGVRQGIAARNWVPIGTIMPDADSYLRIKVREARPGEPCGYGNTDAWPQLHRCIWEHHHGPIPAGHIVVFKSRDRSDCSIENLELITMAENARRNRMWGRLPRELAEVIQLNGVLKRKLRRLTNGKEQAGRSEGSPVRDDRAAEGSRQTDGPGARSHG